MKPNATITKLNADTRTLLGTYIRTGILYALLIAFFWLIGYETIYQHLTPFYALMRPTILHDENTLWHIQSIIIVGVLIAITIKIVNRFKLFDDTEPDPKIQRKFIAWCILLAIIIPISIAMMRGGFDGITQAYDRHGYEYNSDIGKGGSIQGLFSEYEKNHQFLSMHAKVHPPGAIALLWLMSMATFTTSPLILSFGTILLGGLSVIPFYLWTRDLFNPRVATQTTLLYIFVPTIVLFTATSADIMFMPFTLTTLMLFWRSITQGSFKYAVLAGIFYAFCTLLSFSLIGIGAFFGLIGLWKLKEAETRLHVIVTASGMIIGLIAIHLAVYFWSDFNVFRAFELCKAQFDLDQHHLDLNDPRPASWVFKFINPLCWFFFAGIPISVLAIKQFIDRTSDHRTLFIVIALTLFVLNLLYLARGEGERSAMYIMPFIVIPAGYYLAQLSQKNNSNQVFWMTLILLAIQCWFTEAMLYTYW